MIHVVATQSRKRIRLGLGLRPSILRSHRKMFRTPFALLADSGEYRTKYHGDVPKIMIALPIIGHRLLLARFDQVHMPPFPRRPSAFPESQHTSNPKMPCSYTSAVTP
jgi:hypothetical protein